MSEAVRIRPFRRADAPALVDFLKELLRPDDMTNVPGLLHYRAALPRHARSRWWVALSAKEFIGWCLAELRIGTSKPGVGQIWVGVRPDYRRRGVGSRLFILGKRHLRSIGARELRTWARHNSGSGQRFLRGRGFQRSRSAKAWALDPRTVNLKDLPRLKAAAAKAGFRLARLRELLHRPRDLHRLYARIALDVPSSVPTDRIPFREWERLTLQSPTLDPDGSFVVLSGDQLVALAWLDVDIGGRRAANYMTGTLPAHRHRGLGRLVKLATIRWAVRNRISAVYTSNDSTNADMLALNEHLGYRPLPGHTSYVRSLR